MSAPSKDLLVAMALAFKRHVPHPEEVTDDALVDGMQAALRVLSLHHRIVCGAELVPTITCTSTVHEPETNHDNGKGVKWWDTP
jgi:hypothetical protein